MSASCFLHANKAHEGAVLLAEKSVLKHSKEPMVCKRHLAPLTAARVPSGADARRHDSGN